jgi:hypothetical protein
VTVHTLLYLLLLTVVSLGVTNVFAHASHCSMSGISQN